MPLMTAASSTTWESVSYSDKSSISVQAVREYKKVMIQALAEPQPFSDSLHMFVTLDRM